MNKNILYLSIAFFVTGTLLSGCLSTDKKVENAEDKLLNAKENYMEAERNLDETIKDSISNYQQFKNDAELSILAYEKSIAELKLKIANERIENRAEYEKKLAELELKNKNLRKKLSDYKDEEQDKWATFRSEFIHDMEELGIALKDFTVKNNK